MNCSRVSVLAIVLCGVLAPGLSLRSNASAAWSHESEAELAFHGPPLTLKSSAFDAQMMWLHALSHEPLTMSDNELDQTRNMDGSDDGVATSGVNVRPQQRRRGFMSHEELSGNGLFASPSSLRAWKAEDMEPKASAPAGLNQKKSIKLGESLPNVDLSYSHAAPSDAPQPPHVAPSQAGVDTIEGGLSFSRSDWTARVLSSYQAGEELWFNGAGSTERGHALGGSYRLTNSMIVAPSLSYREISQRWSSARTDIPSASLSLTYSPLQDLKLSTVGSYSRTLGADRLIDRDDYQIRSEMSLTSRRSSSLETTLSIAAGYQNSKDRLAPTGALEDVSGFLRLRMTGFN